MVKEGAAGMERNGLRTRLEQVRTGYAWTWHGNVRGANEEEELAAGKEVEGDG